MSFNSTPASKRRYNFTVQSISPPTKRSSIGTNKANVTIRARRSSTAQGGQDFPQSIITQLANLSQLEQKPPMLDNATIGEFIIFKPLFENYKAKQGTKPLADLLSIKAKNFLCSLYNKTTSDFYLIDDDDLMQLLEEHFQILDTNDYVAKLQATYMIADQVDIQKIQLYAQNFMNVLHNNPSYTDTTIGGGTAKTINMIFINGFKPQGVRLLVQDLGTENINMTLSKLNTIYSDIRTTMRVQRRLGSLITTPDKDGKQNLPVGKIDTTPTRKGCTSTHCVGRSTSGAPHKAENCWELHPEKRNQRQQKEVTPKKGMMTSTTTPEAKTAPDTKMDELYARIAQLQIDVQEVKVLKQQRLNTIRIAIPPDKPHYLDSGNNYSVIASTSHIDPDTHIQLSSRVEKLETASGQQLEISGTGKLIGVDAIYVPDSIASLSSVSQINEKRNAVTIFFKDGSISVKLNNDIINYLSKIKQIASTNNLILLETTLNHDQL